MLISSTVRITASSWLQLIHWSMTDLGFLLRTCAAITTSDIWSFGALHSFIVSGAFV